MGQTITPCNIPVKRWSLDEFYRLQEAGFVTRRSELIEGVIFEPPTRSPFHVYVMNFLGGWLRGHYPGVYIGEGNPLDISEPGGYDSEPEPDLAVYTVSEKILLIRHPHPQETLLVIEIACSTREYDLGYKVPLYARSGIVECWIVDVEGRQVIVHRDPQNGSYSSVRGYDETAHISPLAKPEAFLAVSELMPALGENSE